MRYSEDAFLRAQRVKMIILDVDGVLTEIKYGMKVDRYKNHSIELVIDKLRAEDKQKERLKGSVDTAFKQGDGQLMILDADDNNHIGHYSRKLMDPVTGLSYAEPAPHNFSFNSPQGACRKCKGLGYVNIIDRDKIMPNTEVSIYDGGILPLGKYKNSLIFWQISAICEKYGVTIKTPIKDLPDEVIDDIMNGTDEHLDIKNDTMSTSNYFLRYDGLVKYIEMQQSDDASAQAQKWAGQFFSRVTCPECNGARLNKEALHYYIGGKNIADLSAMDISELQEWMNDIKSHLTDQQWNIAKEIVKEISGRLNFLVDVGLDYLALNRNSSTLSGGESQRIRLATQIGSQLVNVLYILDEPSIGLHQRDNVRLISSLKKLRDAGNTVIVVEHDKDMMLQSDYIVDIGPHAGRKGGRVVFSGTPGQMLESDTITAQYLNGKRKIDVPAVRRQGNGSFIELKGCRGNNLRNVDVKIPLGVFVCVTGVVTSMFAPCSAAEIL